MSVFSGQRSIKKLLTCNSTKLIPCIAVLYLCNYMTHAVHSTKQTIQNATLLLSLQCYSISSVTTKGNIELLAACCILYIQRMHGNGIFALV